MKGQSKVRNLYQHFANKGLSGTAQLAIHRVRDRLQMRAAGAEETTYDLDWQSNAVHPFDQKHGVETSGILWPSDLKAGKWSDRWNTAYFGVAPSVFRQALALIPEDLHDFTFIDLGSGKGRAVLLASEYPFAHVYGVEISPKLHSIAVDNLARFTQEEDTHGKVQFICKDVTEFRFPDDPLVVYLYNPFCKPVLRRVLDSLNEALKKKPRRTYIIYLHDELRELLDSASFLQRIHLGKLQMSDEDRGANRIGNGLEVCSIYQSRCS